MCTSIFFILIQLGYYHYKTPNFDSRSNWAFRTLYFNQYINKRQIISDWNVMNYYWLLWWRYIYIRKMYRHLFDKWGALRAVWMQIKINKQVINIMICTYVVPHNTIVYIYILETSCSHFVKTIHPLLLWKSPFPPPPSWSSYISTILYYLTTSTCRSVWKSWRISILIKVTMTHRYLKCMTKFQEFVLTYKHVMG